MTQPCGAVLLYSCVRRSRVGAVAGVSPLNGRGAWTAQHKLLNILRTTHIYTVHSTEQSMPRLDCTTTSVWFADGRSFGVCTRVLLDSQLDLLLGDRSGLAHRVRWADQQQQRNEQQVRKG